MNVKHRVEKLEAKTVDNSEWSVEKIKATYTPAEWQRVMAQVRATVAEHEARLMGNYEQIKTAP